MKQKYNLIIIVLLIGLTISSCELWYDVDDAKPYYKQTEEASYSTLKGINSNVSGMYAASRGPSVSYVAEYGGQMAGLYNPAWELETDQTKVLMTVEDSRTEGIYLDWYKQISAANYLIKNLKDIKEGEIEGLTLERRDEIIGEAKFARAMGHFEVFRVFAYHYDINSIYGIPYVTTVLTEPPFRNTVEEVYDGLYADLDDAMTAAPEGINRQKYTQLTAQALKAKVALYRKDYATASSLALDIIQNSGFTLEANYADIFIEGYESEEVIFSPYTINYDEYFSHSNAWTSNVNDLFKQLAGNGDDFTGVGYDPRYANSHAWDVMPPGGANGKFPPKWNMGDPGNSYHYLRLAELYYIYAEAEARLASDNTSDPHFIEAVAKVNVIRGRVGLAPLVPVTKAELIEAIRIEKIMELHLEWGEPWIDMVRYHFIGDIDISTIRGFEINDYRLTYPFNVSTLNGNPNLVQNPGYIGAEE